MRAQPAPRRSAWREGATGREVVIPPRRNRAVIVLLPLWLSLWSIGIAGAAGEVASGRARGGEAGVLELWVAGAVLGAGLAAYTWLWNAIGREVVGIGPGVLRVRREMAGLGFTREFALAGVRNLRVSPDPSELAAWVACMRRGRGGAGPIAFDYGAATVRFGDGLDEAEAALVVAEVGSGSGAMRPAA
jgi:hypothetical protein